MAQVSAGILLYRHADGQLQFLLVHPGGPYFARKDEGAWSIPKGLVDGEEPPLDAARREFAEETGIDLPDGEYHPLGEVRLRSGKLVRAWATQGDCDPTAIVSNTFEIEWPPRSGRRKSFPEVDRAAFFDAERAKRKLNPAQAAFIDRACARLLRDDDTAVS